MILRLLIWVFRCGVFIMSFEEFFQKKYTDSCQAFRDYVRGRVQDAIDGAKRCTEYYNQTVYGCHYNDYLRGNLESILADFAGLSVYDLFYKGKQHV